MMLKKSTTLGGQVRVGALLKGKGKKRQQDPKKMENQIYEVYAR